MQQSETPPCPSLTYPSHLISPCLPGMYPGSLAQSQSHPSRCRLSSENDAMLFRKPSLAHSRFWVSILVHDCLSASNPPSCTLLYDRTLQTSFLLYQRDPCWTLPKGGTRELGCKVGGRSSSPIIPLASCRHPVSFLFLAAPAQSCLSTSEVIVWSSNISCIQVSVSPSNFRTCFVVLCQKHQHQLGVGPSSEVSTLHVPSSTLRTINTRRKGPPPQRAEFQL